MAENLNQDLLINLSLITALHDKNKTVLDMFLPIVKQGIFNLQVKNSNEYCDIVTLQNELKSQLGVEISELSLITFLKRLEKDNLIKVFSDKREYKVLIEQTSTEYLDAIDDKRRDIRYFISEFIKFARFENDHNKATRFIFEFLEQYRIYIDDKCNVIKRSEIASKYECLIEFINQINDNNNQLRHIFIDIYTGYCLCNILIKTPNNKLSERTFAFSNICIYLDSNFILRLLDLQDDYFTKQTKELFDAMQAEGITIKVFNETVDEIKSVILYRGKNYFDNMFDKNPTTYLAEGITGALSRRKLSRTQLNSIVDSLDLWLSENNIARDSLESYNLTVSESDIEDLNELKYQNSHIEIDSQESIYRRRKSETYCKIISVIKRRNNGYRVNLSNYKYLFLTCDNSVYIYSKRRTNSSYASFVQNQETMANALLLIYPQKFHDIAISNVIATLKADKQFNLSDFAKWNETCCDFAEKYPNMVEYVKSCIDDSDCFSRIKDIYANDQGPEKQKREVMSLMSEKINDRILKDEELSRKINSISDKEKHAESLIATAEKMNIQAQEQLNEAKKINSEVIREREVYQNKKEQLLNICNVKYNKMLKYNKIFFYILSVGVSISLIVGTIILGYFEYRNTVGIGFTILMGVIALIGLLLAVIPKARENILDRVNKKAHDKCYRDYTAIYDEDVPNEQRTK